MIAALNEFAKIASARSKMIGIVLVLLMAIMMAVPLPPFLLDILIVLNMAVAVVLLVCAALLKKSLVFSSFPAILLMTTLFRLVLNISITRQILREANTGRMVQIFGEFGVGDGVAMGFTIFLIVSMINFVVIIQGSKRVLRTCRLELEKEPHHLDTVKGAIKFARNEAFAGLLITVVNSVGGVIVGILIGMNFAQASRVYTVLSVGAGLVSILPSLITSIAVGLFFSRVAKDKSNQPNSISSGGKNLSKSSKVLQLMGVVCCLLAFVPGLPSYVLLSLGGALLVMATFKF